MMDRRFVEQLVWEIDPINTRSYVAECRITEDRFRMVWQKPCWCLRLEPRGRSYQWMGQFPEPGGIDLARKKAQVFHDRRLRRLAWQAYMEENDPPWPDLGKA